MYYHIILRALLGQNVQKDQKETLGRETHQDNSINVGAVFNRKKIKNGDCIALWQVNGHITAQKQGEVRDDAKEYTGHNCKLEQMCMTTCEYGVIVVLMLTHQLLHCIHK